MINPYISSLINQYGDTANVKRDAAVIKDIFNRQGCKFLVDSIAENVASVSNHQHLSRHETDNLCESLVNDLDGALRERL